MLSKVFVRLLWLCFLPSLVFAKNFIAVEHPDYSIKIDPLSATIVQYTVKAEDGKGFSVLTPQKPGMSFSLAVDGKEQGKFGKPLWSVYPAGRQRTVKDKRIYVFFDMALPEAGVKVTRSYSFDPENSRIRIGHTVSNIREKGGVKVKVTARLVPDLPGSGEAQAHIVPDAGIGSNRKVTANYQVMPLAKLTQSRWTVPKEKKQSYPLIGLENGVFVGLRSPQVLSSSPGTTAIDLDKASGGLGFSAESVPVSAGKNRPVMTLEMLAEATPQRAFAQLGFPFDRLKAPVGESQNMAQASTVSPSVQKAAASSNRSAAIEPASVASAKPSLSPAPKQVNEVPLPAPFATGDDLIPWVFKRQEAIVRAYGGKYVDEEDVQQVMDKFRRSVEVRSCARGTDEWFADLGVYYVSFVCKAQEGDAKAGATPKVGSVNGELYLTWSGDQWVMALEGDAVACAVARRENNDEQWASYQKRYPNGQCARQAVAKTVEPVQQIATVDLASAFAFSADGARLFSIVNKELRIYTVADGKLLKQVPLSVRTPRELHVSRDEGYALVNWNDRKAYLVDIEASKVVELPLREINADTSDELRLAFDDEAGHAVLVYEPGFNVLHLDRFDLKTGKRVKQFDDQLSSYATALSPDGQHVAVIGAKKIDKNTDPRLAVHRTRDGKKLWEQPIARASIVDWTDLVFSDSGQYVFYDLKEGLAVRETQGGKALFENQPGWLKHLDADDVRLNPEGSLMLESDNSITSLYDFKTGKHIYRNSYRPSRTDSGAVPTARFSPDNQYFVVQFEEKGTIFKLVPEGIERVLKK